MYIIDSTCLLISIIIRNTMRVPVCVRVHARVRGCVASLV